MSRPQTAHRKERRDSDKKDESSVRNNIVILIWLGAWQVIRNTAAFKSYKSGAISTCYYLLNQIELIGYGCQCLYGVRKAVCLKFWNSDQWRIYRGGWGDFSPGPSGPGALRGLPVKNIFCAEGAVLGRDSVEMWMNTVKNSFGPHQIYFLSQQEQRAPQPALRCGKILRAHLWLQKCVLHAHQFIFRITSVFLLRPRPTRASSNTFLLVRSKVMRKLKNNFLMMKKGGLSVILQKKVHAGCLLLCGGLPTCRKFFRFSSLSFIAVYAYYGV